MRSALVLPNANLICRLHRSVLFDSWDTASIELPRFVFWVLIFFGWNGEDGEFWQDFGVFQPLITSWFVLLFLHERHGWFIGRPWSGHGEQATDHKRQQADDEAQGLDWWDSSDSGVSAEAQGQIFLPVFICGLFFIRLIFFAMSWSPLLVLQEGFSLDSESGLLNIFYVRNIS